ncbi:DedA family protein [Mesobacillus harenae]|uniref:DedA family protein n=1 Tax=Mesobacillus harenae TaxID=2213203 RepID=UPI0015808DC6|nr:DedA family protein [Mesobacillus harenae]
MDLDLISIIEQKGYIGLFLWLWFGVFVIPVPNELITMSVGLASSLKILNPITAFIVTYLGILAALTTSYTFGRLLSKRSLSFFRKRKRVSNTIQSSLRLMEKYHAFSLFLSYFVPGLRSFVPLLYGFSRLPFKTFMLFAFLGAFVWLLIMFTLGYLFGDHIHTIMYYGRELLLAIGVIVFILAAIKIYRRKKRKKVNALNGG